MVEPSLRTTARQLGALALLTFALVWALASPNTPAAQACQTCLSETGTAYTYCRNNPDGEYHGCNFSTACAGGTRTATQIYRDECCDMPVHDSGWTIYCL
jgi:hypothetical protein